MFYRINGCNMIIYVKSIILLLQILLWHYSCWCWCLLLCIEHTVHPIDFVLFFFIVVSRQLWLLTSKKEGLTWNATLLASISVSILFRLSSLSFFSLLLLFFSFFFLFCLRLQHGKIASLFLFFFFSLSSFLWALWARPAGDQNFPSQVLQKSADKAGLYSCISRA